MTVVETRNARQELQRRVRGAVIEPGGPGWEAATQAFNLSFVQEPTLVAVPEDERDVVAIVGPAWYEASVRARRPAEKETRTAHAATSAWASASGIGTLLCVTEPRTSIGITEPALRCSAGSGSRKPEELGR